MYSKILNRKDEQLEKKSYVSLVGIKINIDKETEYENKSPETFKKQEKRKINVGQ